MTKAVASLSLDLDNLWSYLKTHGDPGWESYPTYLDIVVPRVLAMLAERDLRITFFIVGQDAARDENHAALASISAAGHEIGNHSFRHEPWLHLYSPAELTEELDRAEEALESATGQRPLGFRGPGYSFTPQVAEELVRRGYRYDASSFPTFLGPLARSYYFFTARLSKTQRQERKQLFGKWSDGFKRLKPHRLETAAGALAEIPVTTMPIVRSPIHASYLLYLDRFSRPLAKAYFRLASLLCRVSGTHLSMLLHPLDFLGGDDTDRLSFFPAMNRPAARKLEFMGWLLDEMTTHFEVVPMRDMAASMAVDGAPRIATDSETTDSETSQPACVR